MLRYDAAWLIEQYGDEVLAGPGLPYARIGGAGPYDVVRSEEPFRLHDVLGLTPRLDYDEPVVRLAALDGNILRVQRAAFSDSAKSNYAMDGPGELRETLRAQYGPKLPPLCDPRLSNGMGTAIVVFDRANRPYLPRRAPQQAVFPAGYHCTASGEAAWTEAQNFDGLFTANICRELEEEVGLQRADLDWIRLVAFCRELLRAGKPQFFFAAATSLSDAKLRERRLEAIERQLAAGRQETLDDVLAEITPETLKLCTLECVANLVLAG
jgi:8-oxo-dGTP pyrophosphatase MutT (NUDIX family)